MDCSDLLMEASCPVLFNGYIDHWSAKHWTPTHLAEVLQGKTYRCKIAPQNSTDQVWETDCGYVEASLSEFCEWSSGKCKGDNPLRDVDQSKFSCYVDYKYMPQMFEDKPQLMKGVDWSVLGLPGRDGEDSTIWVGSAGAATPCHYDTYGFNLVAQLHGKKRWHLFPPTSDCQYPTRLPYEESSVFSEVNVGHPDLDRTPDFMNCHGVVVTLCPGDVLYVPRHWWHYVECLETAVSVNTWVEVPDDDTSKVREAVTRATVSCLVSGEAGSSLQDWINPNEEIASMDINWTYLWKSLNKVIDNKREGTSIENKLHTFASFFKGQHYNQVQAPWDVSYNKDHFRTIDVPVDQFQVPETILTAKKRTHSELDYEQKESKRRILNSEDHSNKSVVSENSDIEVSRQEEASSGDSNVVAPILNDSENIKENKESKGSIGPKYSPSTSESKADQKRIYALRPSSFKAYWNVAHGGRTHIHNVCDTESHPTFIPSLNELSSNEPLLNRFSSKEEFKSSQESLRGQATEPSEGGHLPPSEGTQTGRSDGEAGTGQGLGGRSGHGQLPASGQLSSEGDNIDICAEGSNGQGHNHSSSSGQSSSRDDHLDQSLVSGQLSHENDNVDLCAMRDMYFRTLLHPNVVEVIAEELLKKFQK